MTTLPELETVAGATVHGGPQLPRLPGFMESDFAPLVYAAVRACVGEARSEHLLTDAGDRCAIVLGSRYFDTVTLELSVEHVNRKRVNPIFFYQAVPTAVLGQIARDYRLTGPVSCVAALDDVRAEVHELARVILADGGADQVLGLVVEMRPDPALGFARADLMRAVPGPAGRKGTP
ncbi:hypothetical protein ABZ252_13555 [Streptomyces sp. NPDC006175]|uniref:hypothetical protein n=1 Tax=Streptomyces sp. NPDC006175 TaxID=3154471 RepID=UPI0033B6C03C